MPIARSSLLKDLQVLLKKLEADLIDRSTSTEIPEIGLRLRSTYEQAKSAQHTAQSFEEWRSLSVAQVAAAWVLSCVFVRFLEDNGMIDPPRLAGVGDRLSRARDEHELYFQKFPTHSDRDYLLSIFKDLAKLPVAGEVFGEGNGIWRMANWLSGDAAALLLRFFQKIDANTGLLVHDFTDPNWDTRFLGDLYQDLSEAVRKQYALLQTPDFVEAFILDRTLEPALKEFGLDGFKMIDPACGSGHFLLGSFTRLCDRLLRNNPSENVRVVVQTALDSIYGVDINPYAIAIARFRLLLAAMKVSGITRLVDAPNFQIHLVCGDSLLYGSPKGDQLTTGWHVLDEVMMAQDSTALNRILQPYQYHAVVANPPYITPKDAALNKAYRDRYSTCHMKYSLAVPFLERIVSLNIKGGYSGQITANSFMKREFGKRLIEDFFPRVDLTHVIDTSGAYIPGHGTPTVILFARNQKPVAATIRTVMGIRGEPSTPESAVNGRVWQAILNQVDVVDSQSEFVSVADSQRLAFHKHPWSIGGGGASELKAAIDKLTNQNLSKLVDSIGPASFAGVDDMFFSSFNALRTRNIPLIYIRPLCNGDIVRDWNFAPDTHCIVPYSANQDLVPFDANSSWGRYLWMTKISSEAMVSFGQKTRKQLNEPWWSWYRWIPERYRNPLSIAFAFVASHNHFVLDRGGKVFKQSAPVIKLPTEATEADHLALIGLLNSSTACFWMKQVSQQKQMTAHDSVRIESIAKVPHEFAGTQLQKLPLPPNWDNSPLRPRLLQLAKRADQLGQELSNLTALNAIEQGLRLNQNLRTTWENCLAQRKIIRSELIFLQEEIDFVCYCLYQLADESLLSPDSFVFSEIIDAGDRPFCIIKQHNQEGFPVPSEIPSHWTEELKELWQKRINAINDSSYLKLLEDPHYKRRWIGRQGKFNHSVDSDELAPGCESWLLDRLETYFDFDGRMNNTGTPTNKIEISITSIAKLADIAKSDSQFITVGELYRNDPAFKIEKLITELVEAESVPHLPILRYKVTGLRKRLEWEHTWELQRQEDTPPSPPLERGGGIDSPPLQGGARGGSIPVPPKYASTDFLKPNYWRLRGKLDVPKERWIAFPHCQSEDGTLAIAWAGYNHLQLAQTLSTYYIDIKERIGGSNDPRLAPLLASLVELIPWLKQWHNDIDPEFGLAMGDYYEGFLIEEAKAIGHTVESLKAWEPVGKVKSKK